MKNLNVLSWFDKDTVKHLRLPFSLYLMPVFLFALSQADSINWPATLLSFLILHVLIFPSSNGYNSYQDRDETSIGGLKYPPKVSRNLFYGLTPVLRIAKESQYNALKRSSFPKGAIVYLPPSFLIHLPQEEWLKSLSSPIFRTVTNLFCIPNFCQGLEASAGP